MSPNLVEGVRLGANSAVEFAIEFRLANFATHSPKGEELGTKMVMVTHVWSQDGAFIVAAVGSLGQAPPLG